MFYREDLTSFDGTKSFLLYKNIEDAKSVLEAAKVEYTEEL